MVKPWGNNVLIEVLRDYDSVARSDENESMQSGRLLDFGVSSYHLTASSAINLSPDFTEVMVEELNRLIANEAIVRWEQYAEGGQTFVEDGKTYALVPWWRLIGYEYEQKKS